MLDQPAAGKPTQHPHAYLLGDGGDSLWCQFSGGAKAHGFRGIIGIRDRLEDPVDDAAMTNPPGADLGARQGARSAKTRMVFVIMDVLVEGGTEAVDEAHRPEVGLRAGAAALAQMGLDDAQ